jgi:hypothetical protein
LVPETVVKLETSPVLDDTAVLALVAEGVLVVISLLNETVVLDAAGVVCTSIVDFDDVKVAWERGTVELMVVVVCNSVSIPSPQSAIGAALMPTTSKKPTASGSPRRKKTISPRRNKG